jgi:multidrug/hemolysin transport system permease protein
MLIKRNILLFFRDKANVFFSLLAVLIIIALYIVFLGDQMTESFESLPAEAYNAGFTDKMNILAAGLMLSGMIAVTSVTSSMGALGVAVTDKLSAYKDFATTPVKRAKTAYSYIAGAAVCSVIMTTAALALSLLYLTVIGGDLPTLTQWGKILIAVILSVLCGNAMVYFISTFIRTASAFTALSTILGTLIGFVMGIYIPIGTMSEGVAWIIRCFPMSHAASMFKLAIIDDELTAAFTEQTAEGMREMFGVTFTYGDFTSSYTFSAGVLIVFTIVFFGLAVLSEKLHKTKA